MATLCICDECRKPIIDGDATETPVVVRSKGGTDIEIGLVVHTEGVNLHPHCARRIVEAGELLQEAVVPLNARKRRLG